MKRVSPASPLKIRALRLVGSLTNAQALLMQAFRADPDPVKASGRILVIRLDETIGDSVMFSAFLRELRRARPDAEITVVINDARRDMYRHCPYVDRVVPTSFGSGATLRLLGRPLLEWWWCKTVLGRGFELAFVPRADYDHHAVFIAAAAQSNQIVAYESTVTARKKIVGRGIERLIDITVPWSAHEHETDRSLALLEVVGYVPIDRSTELWIGSDEEREASRACEGLGDARYAVLAPSGGHSVLKPWPVREYQRAADRLLAEGYEVVIVGAPHDGKLVYQFDPPTRRRMLDLTGQLSVMATAAVIKRADLFIGSDSGMSHVSAASGVRTLAVFGPGCPHTFGPRGRNASAVTLDLECGPCHSKLEIDQCVVCVHDEPICMTQLTADQVLAQRSVNETIARVDLQW